MKQFRIIPLVAILASTLLAGGVSIASADEVVKLQPGKGMSFVVGSKRATTYFHPIAGDCEVTLMLGEVDAKVGKEYLTASRLKIRLEPGNITRIDTFKGKSLSLVCDKGAKTLSVVDQRLKLTKLVQ